MSITFAEMMGAARGVSGGDRGLHWVAVQRPHLRRPKECWMKSAQPLHGQGTATGGKNDPFGTPSRPFWWSLQTVNLPHTPRGGGTGQWVAGHGEEGAF